MLNKLLKKYVDDIPSLDGSLIDADYLEIVMLIWTSRNSFFISLVILPLRL